MRTTILRLLAAIAGHKDGDRCECTTGNLMRGKQCRHCRARKTQKHTARTANVSH